MGNKLSNESMNELKKYGGESLDTLVHALLGGELTAITRAFSLAKDAPFFVSNAVFMVKYEKLLPEIYYDSSDMIIISNKLFGEDSEERINNAIRTITLVDKIDTMTKIDYLLNANRSFSNGCITREQLFRIANALANTLSEDLEYLKKHALDEDLTGNVNVQALANIGAVIIAEIDANADVEKQTYVVIKFGQILDKYALSVMDDERQGDYRENNKKQHTFDFGFEPIREDEM